MVANVIVSLHCPHCYSSFLLLPLQKFFVDKGSNKNGFVLFARQLSIRLDDTGKYWIWTEEKNAR